MHDLLHTTKAGLTDLLLLYNHSIELFTKEEALLRAIISCMDTKLIESLSAALGSKNGDVKIIKNAGGIISHPFGSAMRRC